MAESSLEGKTNLTEWELTKRHFSALGNCFKSGSKVLVLLPAYEALVNFSMYFGEFGRTKALNKIYNEEMSPIEIYDEFIMGRFLKL